METPGKKQNKTLSCLSAFPFPNPPHPLVFSRSGKTCNLAALSLSSCRQQKSWELELGNSGHYCQSQDPKPEVSWQADRANLVSIFQPFPFYIQTPQKSWGQNI